MTLEIGNAKVSLQLPPTVRYGYSKIGDNPGTVSFTGPLEELQKFCQRLLNETTRGARIDGQADA
jgi:hypothetical protein